MGFGIGDIGDLIPGPGALGSIGSGTGGAIAGGGTPLGAVGSLFGGSLGSGGGALSGLSGGIGSLSPLTSGLGGLIGSAIGQVGNVISAPVGALGQIAKNTAGAFTTQPGPGNVQQFLNAQTPGGFQQQTDQWSQTGVNNANTNYQQQQALVAALQNQAAGGGPSPSTTMLQQSAAQQAANANSLAASQRGVNPALAMKTAQETAANAQQNAAQNAVVARQQEQLNAQGQLGGALQGIGNQALQQGQGYGQLAQGYGQQALNAQNANTGYTFQNAGIQNAATAGLMNALGGALGLQGAGGNFSSGNTTGQAQAMSPVAQAGTQGAISGAQTGTSVSNSPLSGGGLSSAISGAAGGGAAGLASGGRVSGKAKTPGDSPKNDKIHAMLSPGEVVIPRTKAKDPDKAKEFVAQLLKKENKGGRVEFKDVLKSRQRKKAA